MSKLRLCFCSAVSLLKAPPQGTKWLLGKPAIGYNARIGASVRAFYLPLSAGRRRESRFADCVHGPGYPVCGESRFHLEPIKSLLKQQRK
jgi:hypothetical protein